MKSRFFMPHLKLKNTTVALATVDQVVGASSAHTKRSQVQFLVRVHTEVCRFNPQSRCMLDITNRCFSLSTPSSLSRINKHMLG